MATKKQSRLGDKPLTRQDKNLDFIGAPEKKDLKQDKVMPFEGLDPEVTKKDRPAAVRLSLTADPELVERFDVLCGRWAGVHPKTYKKDICNKMISEFLERWEPEIDRRLAELLKSS